MNTLQSIVDDLDYKLHSSYGLACPKCSWYFWQLPALDLNIQLMSDYTCGNCHITTGLWAWNVYLIEEHRPFAENPDSIRDMVFYHATKRQSWWYNLPEDLLIHFGSKRAAYERARNEYFLTSDECDVFTLRIKHDAVIADFLLIDDCVDRVIEANEMRVPKTIKPLRKQGIDATVFRYMNEWEAPGSISMVAIKDSIEIVDKRPGKEFFG